MALFDRIIGISLSDLNAKRKAEALAAAREGGMEYGRLNGVFASIYIPTQ